MAVAKLGISCLLLLLIYAESISAVSTTTPRLAPPVLRSCWELYQAGYNSANSWPNGPYMIDPDGPEAGEAAFEIYCDLTNGNTEVGHNHESAESVPTSSVEPGSHSVPITYEITWDQVVALVDVSRSCQQEMTYNCQGAPIWDEDDKPLTWWLSRDDFTRYNWGAGQGTRGCSCSESLNCNEGEEFCNCDVGDSMQRMDTGVITEKDLLPVKELRFGGVEPGDQASHALGKLICTGPSAPTYRSCRAIFDAPNNWDTTEYFMIDVDGEGIEDPFLVYCNAGETWVPHNLCDMGCRVPGDGITLPDCDVDSYEGERFAECEPAGCASVSITYDEVQTSQMVGLIDDASTSCVQELRVNCRHSAYTNNNRWWYGRYDFSTPRYNWGSADAITASTGSSNGCECAMHASGCSPSSITLDSNGCYCDKDDAVLRYDKGTVDDESTLPIVQVLNGDTGANFEWAFINVGHLECTGNALLDECATGVHACDANALCTDTATGYTCECNDGYWGSGYNCEAIRYHIICDNFTVVEGEESVSFNVFRTGSNGNGGSVQVNFVNNDAVLTSDFKESSVSAVFPSSSGLQAGTQSVPVSVNIENDEITEGNETFSITLSNPVNGNIQAGWWDTAIVNVVDDDTSFGIELDKYEVNEDVGYVDIVIIRLGNLERTGSVLLTSTEDSAVAVSDFAAEGNRRISFEIGEDRKTVRIGLLNDFVPEETEVFWVGIEQPINGLVVSFAMTCIRVLDVDTILCPEFPSYPVIEDDTSVLIRLLRSGDVSQPGFVRATAYINDMTTQIPLDQELNMIPADAEFIDIRIDLTEDDILETAETITVYLIDAGEDYICPEKREVIINISDDDSAYALSDTHFTTEERPISRVEIGVLRNGFTQTTGTCRLVTSMVTDLVESAEPVLDYIHQDTLVEFGIGDQYVPVFITIVNDNFLESYEAFVVTLSDCTNGALKQPSSAFVGIIDDDSVIETPNLPSFTLAVDDVYEEEGLVAVHVYKQGIGDASVRVATYPREGSASVTQDFVPVNELVEFLGGITTKTVSIRIENDNTPEATETIVVKLSNPINAVLGDLERRKGVINVLDQDSIVYFRTHEMSVPEGASIAQLEVIRDGYLDQPQTVGVRLSYSKVPGGADADDFTETPASLQFAIGQTSAIAEVPIYDDSEEEETETFQVILSVDPSYPGTLNVVEPDVIVVHILDDDGGNVERRGDQLALIIAGSVVGALVFFGVAGLALAVCFKALAANPPQRQPAGLPPKYPGPPPQQPLVELPPRYGYPPVSNPGYNGGYPIGRR